MKVFVAGATGAIGARLVPLLVERGHEVVGTTRSEPKAAVLREVGAEPVVVDALDAGALTEAVLRAQPDAIVHELTALPEILDPRKFEQSFALTNRLRREATDTLLAAGRDVGVRRFVAQSYAGWPYARVGGPVKTEEDPLDDRPPNAMAATLDAIRRLEDAVTRAGWTEGIVLRYGGFYGPGTSMEPGSAQLELVRKGKFPIVGSGAGVWSFVHVDDAAAATVAAVEHGKPGVYNVVDDDPAPVAEWLPALAELVGGRPPKRVPRSLGRLLVGEAAVVLLDEVRGASNEKAKRELEWQPRYASWRDGFRAALNAPRGAAARPPARPQPARGA
jgi:nucleoside-diphosphate-sugar epimerase